MIDTHTHLYSHKYDDDRTEAVRRALDAGVKAMILPGVNLESVEPMKALYDEFPEVMYLAPGLHPTDAGEDWRDELAEIWRRMADRPAVALGETGIDLYWEKEFLPRQKEAFRVHLDEALRRGLPVIIHSRQATDESFEVIEELEGDRPRMVFHSFTGTPEEARKILDRTDAMFGINGVVTFKNSQPLREAVKLVGLDRIMLETDSPYLAPEPNRGKRNESAWVRNVADRLADLFGTDFRTVDATTDRNAIDFFKL